MQMVDDRPQIRVPRILVPLSLADVGSAHVRTAVMWGQTLNAPLLLLHVLPSVRARVLWQAKVAAGDTSRRAEAERVLRELGQSVSASVPIEIEVRNGQPFEEIARTAAERDCGLIVLSVGGVSHRPGVTATRVVSQSHVPVLVVPNTA